MNLSGKDNKLLGQKEIDEEFDYSTLEGKELSDSIISDPTNLLVVTYKLKSKHDQKYYAVKVFNNFADK